MKAHKLCLVIVVIVVMSSATCRTLAQSPVLVKGQPPLTEEMVGRYAEFFEWAFDVHLTNAQREVLRKYAIDAWVQKKKSDMDDVTQIVQQQVELSKADPQQRSYVRVKIEPQLLDLMRQQPNEPMARWALAVYESAHRAIAPGTPPLTRQSTDAFLEALFFEAGVVSGVHAVPDQKLKDDWARALAANYPRMSADLKQQIAGMPLFMATMRMSWPRLSDRVKAQCRAQWAEQLKGLLPAPSSASASQGAGAPAVGGSVAGKQSIAEMMAEQNRQHQMFMSMSNTMMRIHQSNFNIMANWSGSPYRYW